MDTNEKSVTVNRTTPITMRMDLSAAHQVVDLVREYLGRELDYNLSETNGVTFITFTLDRPDDRPLSVPERTAVETLAKYFRDHAPGLRRGKTLTLPRQVDYHSFSTTKFAFRDEGRAYMAAQMLEECFGYGAEVVETNLGWTIVISPNSDEQEAGLSAEDLCMIQGACQVATDYELIPSENKQYRCEGDELTYDPETRHAWHGRKNAHQQRIEDGINAIGNRTKSILEVVDYVFEKHFRPMETQSPATGSETVAAPAEKPSRGRGLDALIPPASKPSGKGKPKASA